MTLLKVKVPFGIVLLMCVHIECDDFDDNESQIKFSYLNGYLPSSHDVKKRQTTSYVPLVNEIREQCRENNESDEDCSKYIAFVLEKQTEDGTKVFKSFCEEVNYTDDACQYL
ncbi:uncharacterized protein LOC142331581 [Lycorma delicatula]|uniref:uncharacterized protein LOC142331581 n=1 Tax=Lycorma delicatula TaxID=130591 RepID=UPI003F51298A